MLRSNLVKKIFNFLLGYFPEETNANPDFIVAMANLLSGIPGEIWYPGYQKDLESLQESQNELFTYVELFSIPRKLKLSTIGFKEILNDVTGEPPGKDPIQLSMEKILIGASRMWKILCENKDKLAIEVQQLLEKNNSIYIDQNNTPESLFDFRKAGFGIGFSELLQIKDPNVFISNLFPEITEPQTGAIPITRPIIGGLIVIAAVAQNVDQSVRFVAKNT